MSMSMWHNTNNTESDTDNLLAYVNITHCTFLCEFQVFVMCEQCFIYEIWRRYGTFGFSCYVESFDGTACLFMISSELQITVEEKLLKLKNILEKDRICYNRINKYVRLNFVSRSSTTAATKKIQNIQCRVAFINWNIEWMKKSLQRTTYVTGMELWIDVYERLVEADIDFTFVTQKWRNTIFECNFHVPVNDCEYSKNKHLAIWPYMYYRQQVRNRVACSL